MNSNILILPVAARRSYGDPSWCEQYDRERQAAMMNEITPPPRTRPIVVVRQVSDQRGER